MPCFAGLDAIIVKDGGSNATRPDHNAIDA